MTALGENPNSIANTLMIGLLALIGLAYGREEISRRAQALFWFFSAFLFLAIIRTGSRGAIIALLVALAVLLLKRSAIARRLKVALVVVVAVVFVAVASYSIEAVRTRWERTLATGDTAGRDFIFYHATQMFFEKPFWGWGPVYHQIQLGSRLGVSTKDTHNLYLYVLTEVGLFGAIPFFLALFLCYRSAWRARGTIQGILPLSMLASLLVVYMKGTLIHNKLLWLALAYAAASGTYPLLLRNRNRSLASFKSHRPMTYPSPGINRYRKKLDRPY
jgi:O-antigen ligase